MKLVVIFFLSLCLHLLGGLTPAHAGTLSHRWEDAPAQRLENREQAQKLTPHHDHLLTPSGDVVEASVHLLTVEEDDDEAMLKKQLASARFFLAFSYAYLLHYSNHCTASPLFFGKHPSCVDTPRYIVQRVFRI